MWIDQLGLPTEPTDLTVSSAGLCAFAQVTYLAHTPLGGGASPATKIILAYPLRFVNSKIAKT